MKNNKKIAILILTIFIAGITSGQNMPLGKPDVSGTVKGKDEKGDK